MGKHIKKIVVVNEFNVELYAWSHVFDVFC